MVRINIMLAIYTPNFTYVSVCIKKKKLNKMIHLLYKLKNCFQHVFGSKILLLYCYIE